MRGVASRWFNQRQMVADYLPDGTTAQHIPRLSKVGFAIL